MDVFAAIQGRRSIRQYSAKPVEEEKLRKVLEAARLSPSLSNGQAWKFVVVRDQDIKSGLAEAAGGQIFIKQSPVVIVACGTEPSKLMKCGLYAYNTDVSIAVGYMLLQAHELGLGTCWIGHFDEGKVKELLGIPQEIKVVAMTPLGYPGESPVQRPRKDIRSIIAFDRYE